MRNGTRVVFALTAAILGGAVAAGSGAAESGVKAGYLKCDVEGNVSFVFGSSRDVNCTYTPDGKGRVDRYSGTIDKYGVDIGYLENGVILWGVVAPTDDVGPGALAGNYGGVTGSAAVGVGAGANVLVGGSEESIVLQLKAR